MIPGKGARHNPFSSERVCPGALAFSFSSASGLESLLRKLETCGMAGQIVGPHGSGKSTLLHTLGAALSAAGWEVQYADSAARPSNGRILLLESGERIPRPRITAMARESRRRGGGLIVTTHEDIGLPVLIKTEVTLQIASRIVAELLADSAVQLPVGLIPRLLELRGGNMRFALFDLYDWYEEAARGLPEDPVEVEHIEEAAYHQRVG